MTNDTNIDQETVESFSREWLHFDQSKMTNAEDKKAFSEYFSVFPKISFSIEAEGFDMGCGSGRWAKHVAPLVGKLNCIDPSEAIKVAEVNLKHLDNVNLISGSLNEPNLKPNSQDFGYCLGVLHHIPNTGAGIEACVSLLKPGAPFLLYIYYSFENRPMWFRFLWKISDLLRRSIIRCPDNAKVIITDIIALLVYLPIARISYYLEKFGIKCSQMPLYYYRDRTFYTMRTDSRDRFGTPLEKRFSKNEISQMMEKAGLIKIVFSDQLPYWCAVGFKKE